jgi:hypothetical protein
MVVAERFLLQAKLGSGPSGATFQALDQSSRQTVALKIVEGARVRSDRLPRHLKKLLDLDLPTFERPSTFGLDGKDWYFVRGDVKSDTIDLRLWREPIAWGEALNCVKALATALVPLHRAGLAHLGLSSSNVLVTGRGYTLLDAGISYLEPTMLRLRALPTMDLHVNLAPEQVLGAKGVGPRSDLFALGVLLHEMLSGRGVFSGPYPLAALTRLFHGAPPPPTRVAPGVPRWADDLQAALLQKTTERRPREAEELLEMLERWEQEAPRTPRLPRFGEREQRTQGLLLLGGRSVGERPDALPQGEAFSKQARKLNLLATALPDGSVMVVPPAGSPAEQIASLGKLALEFRAKNPRAPLVLAAGCGEIWGDLPEGDLPDRAAALLQGEARRCKDGAEGVRTDGLVAALLRGLLPLGLDDGGHLLGTEGSPEASPRQEAPEEQPEHGASEPTDWASRQGVLDALGPSWKVALRAGSLFGDICWRSGIEGLVGGALDWPGLLQSGHLRPRLPSRFPGETEFEFDDPALRSSAYRSLVEEDRRAGHRFAAQWLEKAGASADEVVHHLEKSNDPELLVSFCVRQARNLAAQGGAEEALEWLQRGENSGAEDLSELLQLRLQLQCQLGHRTQARKAALRAMEGLPREGAAYQRVLGDLLETCGLVGDLKRINGWLDRLLKQQPGETAPSEAQALLWVQAATAAFRVGKFEAMTALLERLGPQPSWPAALARLQMLRAQRARLAGYPAASLTLHRSAAAALQGAGEATLAHAIDAEIAQDLLDAGATYEAEQLAATTLALARIADEGEVEARCKVTLGLALQRRTSFELARSTVREATSFFGGRGNKLQEGEARCALATILLAASDHEGATREAERAQGALQSFPPSQMRALELLARLRLARGDLEGAQALCEQARVCAEGLGPAVDGATLLRPVRAQLAQLRSERQEARQLLLEIEQHLQDRAAGYAERSLQEAFLRHVPEHARLLQQARLFSILPPEGEPGDG